MHVLNRQGFGLRAALSDTGVRRVAAGGAMNCCPQAAAFQGPKRVAPDSLSLKEKEVNEEGSTIAFCLFFCLFPSPKGESQKTNAMDPPPHLHPLST